jgi:hypothetical protein
MAVNDLIRRQEALQRTQAKYGKLSFELGKCDCVLLARFHLLAMGHKGLPKPGRYSTPAGALRQLKKAGHDNLESMLDSLLPRITPASAVMGDVGIVDGENGEAIMICAGRKWIGFHQDADGLVAVELFQPVKVAWRA